MKRNRALSLGLLVAVSCVPMHAIEIKEVNKTVWSTLKMIAGTVLFVNGLKSLAGIAAIQSMSQDEPDFATQGRRRQTRRLINPLAVGVGIYGVALTGVGAKLMHSGYNGLTEEEEEQVEVQQ